MMVHQGTVGSWLTAAMAAAMRIVASPFPGIETDQ